MKLILRLLALLILLPAIYVIAVLAYAQLTYFKPANAKVIHTMPKGDELTDSTFTAIIWNIGFAGLGAKSDFFYDGGKMVRSPEHLATEYWKGIQKTVNGMQSDFVLLQEVDVNSKRSYHINQVKALKQLANHSAFALNYKVKFVPIKFTNPLGKVESGLLSLSQNQPTESIRYQYPGSYSYPTKLFFLRRCALLQRFPIKDTAKELIVINTHQSAYDDGEMKLQEMQRLYELYKQEVDKGNYVVIGGDFNQIPDFTKETNKLGQVAQVIYPENAPTNRALKTAYSPETTETKVIDYFIVSPNVKVNSIATKDLQFQFSDHQPVELNFTLQK